MLASDTGSIAMGAHSTGSFLPSLLFALATSRGEKLSMFSLSCSIDSYPVKILFEHCVSKLLDRGKGIEAGAHAWQVAGSVFNQW